MNFEKVKQLIIAGEISESIGTKKERTLHQYLKYYFCNDSSYHEQKCGNYIADIMKDQNIIEIQTRSFNTMRDKLDYFLREHQVTIVYPIIHYKYLYNFDETGTLINTRKSPSSKHPLSIGRELYKIRSFLNNPHLSFKCVVVDIKEERIPYIDKYKRQRMTRINQIPTELLEIIDLKDASDYLKLLPSSLPDLFTMIDFKKSLKLTDREASSTLLVLRSLNAIEVVDRIKRSYIYHRITVNTD